MTDQEKLEALQGIMIDLYHILRDISGPEAKKVWCDVPKKSKLRGKPGPKGPRKPDRERELDWLLTLVTATSGEKAIPMLAKALDAEHRGDFGLSEVAIAQRLRRRRRALKKDIAAVRKHNPLPKMPNK